MLLSVSLFLQLRNLSLQVGCVFIVFLFTNYASICTQRDWLTTSASFSWFFFVLAIADYSINRCEEAEVDVIDVIDLGRGQFQ
jgi:hypothetical protein